MSSFPGSLRLLKGGIALIDPQSFAVLRIIVLQASVETELTPLLKNGRPSKTLPYLVYPQAACN